MNGKQFSETAAGGGAPSAHVGEPRTPPAPTSTSPPPITWAPTPAPAPPEQTLPRPLWQGNFYGELRMNQKCSSQSRLAHLPTPPVRARGYWVIHSHLYIYMCVHCNYNYKSVFQIWSISPNIYYHVTRVNQDPLYTVIQSSIVRTESNYSVAWMTMHSCTHGCKKIMQGICRVL